MNSPNFSQFAAGAPAGFGTPAQAPATAAPPALGGFATPGPQQPPPGYGPPLTAPAQFGTPGGFAPPQAPAPGPGGFAPPVPQPNPYAQAPVPMSAPVAQGSAFAKGTFAGANPMNSREDAQPGLYAVEIVKQEQAKRADTGGLLWRSTFKILHVFEGQSPKDHTFSDAEQMGDDRQRQYAAATMLDIAMKAFGVNDPNQFKAGLDGMLPPDVVQQMRASGNQAPGWSEFADAMQSAAVQMSQYFPPNPLAGKRLLVRCTLGAPINKPGTKNHGKQFPQYEYAVLQG